MRWLLIIFLLFLYCGCVFLLPSRPKQHSSYSPPSPYTHKNNSRPATLSNIAPTSIKCTVKNKSFEENIYVYQGNVRTELRWGGRGIISVIKGRSVFLKTENFSLPGYENCSWILFSTMDYQNLVNSNISLNISIPNFGKGIIGKMRCGPAKINNSLFVISSYCTYKKG